MSKITKINLRHKTHKRVTNIQNPGFICGSVRYTFLTTFKKDKLKLESDCCQKLPKIAKKIGLPEFPILDFHFQFPETPTTESSQSTTPTPTNKEFSWEKRTQEGVNKPDSWEGENDSNKYFACRKSRRVSAVGSISDSAEWLRCFQQNTHS